MTSVPTPPQNSQAELSSFTILHMRSRIQNQKMEGLQARAVDPWRMRGQQMNMTSLGNGRKITSPGLSQVCSRPPSSSASVLTNM